MALLLRVVLPHSLSGLKDLLIKVHHILLASPIKFYMIDMLLINNLEVFQDFFFFFCTVRVKVYVEMLILSFLTSVSFSKIAWTNWKEKI